MDEKLMTQAEFAEKYRENASTVSLAIGAAGIESHGRAGGGKRARKLFREGEMVDSLAKLYRARKMIHLRRAAGWEEAAEAVEQIYRDGGCREDYINPVNGRLDGAQRAEKEMRELMK